MVKYSKYLICLVFIVSSLPSQAQLANRSFDPIQRDLEISRITLENYLKQWEGKPLINKISKVEAEYQSDYGVKFQIDAPHADILMVNQVGRMKKSDEEMMEIFYSEEIISLQKQRLDTALNQFIVDFKTYLPTINPNQVLEFSVKVGADDKEDSKVKLVDSYEMLRSWGISDLESFKKEEITKEEFIKRVKRNDKR